MDRTRTFVPALVVLAIACILAAGCTSDTTPADTTPTATATVTAPQYNAGDIVRNPSSTAATAWLVIGYDAASDTYERALVYQNAGGSWGYRKDDRTERADRKIMEKVYTEIVTNIAPSSVKVVTPTTVATLETTRAVTTTSANATPTAAGKPYIERIIPDEGYSGTTVKVTDLVGKNFVTGATVMISRNGVTITATNVRVITPTSLTCDLALPSDAAVGAWDVIVKNPDGQSYTFTNIFEVHKDMSVVTTTSSINKGTVPIIGISPPGGYNGWNEFVITGSKFQSGASVKLQQTDKTDIEAQTVIVESNTTIRCAFLFPPGTLGTWHVLVTNPDATYGRLIDGLTIM